MRVFVMGDIHGAFKALKQCMERSHFNYRKDRLIQLGDVTDRQGEVYDCVEDLLKIDNLITLRGNHDDWMDTFCQTGHHPSDWDYGGKATVASYLERAGNTHSNVPGKCAFTDLLKPTDIPERHQAFYANMQLYYTDKQGRCFVHGGFDRFLPFAGQFPPTYYWDRELWASALEWQTYERSNPGQCPFEIKTKFKEIYLGHSPTTHWNTTLPMQAANVYNLDTGAGGHGKLTIMEVATKKFWQSDPVEQLYEVGRQVTVF